MPELLLVESWVLINMLNVRKTCLIQYLKRKRKQKLLIIEFFFSRNNDWHFEEGPNGPQLMLSNKCSSNEWVSLYPHSITFDILLLEIIPRGCAGSTRFWDIQLQSKRRGRVKNAERVFAKTNQTFYILPRAGLWMRTGLWMWIWSRFTFNPVDRYGSNERL